MYLLLITSIVQIARIMNMMLLPIYFPFLYLIPLVMLTVLAVAKDLGKAKTMIVACVCILCRVIVLIISIDKMSAYGTALVGALGNDITNVLLAGTATFMVMGKYLDKAERGTK